jgi:predicted metal-dependent hydrolase
MTHGWKGIRLSMIRKDNQRQGLAKLVEHINGIHHQMKEKIHEDNKLEKGNLSSCQWTT